MQAGPGGIKSAPGFTSMKHIISKTRDGLFPSNVDNKSTTTPTTTELLTAVVTTNKQSHMFVFRFLLGVLFFLEIIYTPGTGRKTCMLYNMYFVRI